MLKAVSLPNNILSQRRTKKQEYIGIPAVLFTSPKCSTVGKTEKQLIDTGTTYTKTEGNLTFGLISKSLQETVSSYKILLDEQGHILGAHLIGPKADEVINAFAFAIQQNLTAKELKFSFMSYPSAYAEIRYML